MIYVVSGMMRSFTSMMMGCLEAGGMDCVYALSEDKNGESLREMSKEQRQELFANPESFDGKCFKMLCSYGHIPIPQKKGLRYKILLMLRDPTEINASYERLFGKALVYENPQSNRKIHLTPETYAMLIASTLNWAEQRGDIEIAIVYGKKVLENPITALRGVELAGWPINIEKAAAVVRPELCHV